MGKKTFFSRITVFTKYITVLITALYFSSAAAATMKIVELPATGTDKAIDISTEKTYTHTLDFGTNAPATINGVTFEQGVKGEVKKFFEETSSQGAAYTMDDSRMYVENMKKMFYFKIHAGSDVAAFCDGKSADLFSDFLYHDEAKEYVGTGIILTLKGLEADAQYSVRYYYRPWDPPLARPITIFGDGGSPDSTFNDSITIDIDNDRAGAQYLNYTFVSQDDDVIIKFIFKKAGQGAHIYGLTCEKMAKTDVNSKLNSKSSTYGLAQIHLNTSDATIQFQIPQDGNIRVSIFNSVGQHRATLVDGVKKAGKHSVDLRSLNLRSGLYVCKLTVAEKPLTSKLLLMK